MINTLIIGFAVYNLIEYSFHRIAHVTHKYNFVYIAHKKHHQHYPPSDLLSKQYRTSGEGIVAFSVPSLFVLIFMYFSIIPLETFKILMCEFIFLTILSDFIHTQLHIEGSYLEKYDWFNEIRRLHLIHHKKFNKNLSFGGLSYIPDKLIGTYSTK
jgi:sterol desaturase/sphingolipid hydroxylase (fatty acid hydroxylase superfamily)